MNKIHIFLMALVACVLLSACGEKKKSDNIIAPRVVEAVPQEPVKMQEYTDERSVDWLGKSYHVAIHRHASDSLPMVKDETGQEFVDNVFSLVVSRADGSIFFNRKFTKKDVVNYIDENYRKSGVFEGLVFDRAEGDDLILAASVGLPQTDEYIPLVIRLSRMGQISIQRDTQMDTSSPSQDNQKEDDDDGV